MSSLQEQKSFTEKSSKALQDKEKELQKALKDAKVPTLLYLSHCLYHSTNTVYTEGHNNTCLSGCAGTCRHHDVYL